MNAGLGGAGAEPQTGSTRKIQPVGAEHRWPQRSHRDWPLQFGAPKPRISGPRCPTLSLRPNVGRRRLAPMRSETRSETR